MAREIGDWSRPGDRNSQQESKSHLAVAASIGYVFRTGSGRTLIQGMAVSAATQCMLSRYLQFVGSKRPQFRGAESDARPFAVST